MPYPVGHRAAVRKRIMPRATSLWEPARHGALRVGIYGRYARSIRPE
jgi:hypothetical protein